MGNISSQRLVIESMWKSLPDNETHMSELELSSPVSCCSGDLTLGRSVCSFLAGTLLLNILDKIKPGYPYSP